MCNDGVMLVCVDVTLVWCWCVIGVMLVCNDGVYWCDVGVYWCDVGVMLVCNRCVLV